MIIFLRSFKFTSSLHTYHSSKIRNSYFWSDNNHYFIIIFQFIKPSVSNAFVSIIIETSSWLNWSYRFGDSTWSTSFISSASSRMSLRASSTSFVRRRSGVCAISGGWDTQNMCKFGYLSTVKLWLNTWVEQGKMKFRHFFIYFCQFLLRHCSN